MESVLPFLIQTNTAPVHGLSKRSSISEGANQSFLEVLDSVANDSLEQTSESMFNKISNNEQKAGHLLNDFILNGNYEKNELPGPLTKELLEQIFQQPELSLKELMQSLEAVLTSLQEFISVENEDLHEKIAGLLQSIKMFENEEQLENDNIFLSFVSILAQADFTRLFLQQEENLNLAKQNTSVNFNQFIKTIQSLVERFSTENGPLNKLTPEEKIVFEKVLQQLQKVFANEDVIKKAYANIVRSNDAKFQSIYRYPTVYVPIKNMEQKSQTFSSKSLQSETVVSQNANGRNLTPLAQLDGEAVKDQSITNVVNSEGEGSALQRNENTASIATTTPSQMQSGQVKLDTLTLLEGQNRPVSYEQFVKQFASIINRGKMMNNGQLQKLTIQLKPEHLGSLRIELIQQNNELVAKIVSANKAAKDLIESQIQGLRHAFVQQNITVSRIDIETQWYQDERHFNDQEQAKDHDEQGKHQQQDHERETFSETLQETLVNYEV